MNMPAPAPAPAPVPMPVPALALALALALTNCCPRPAHTHAKPAPTTHRASASELRRIAARVDGFERLRERHDVELTIQLPDGRTRREHATGLLAIERPDKLRLLALGPAGVKLFDLRVVGKRVELLSLIGGAARRDRLRPVLRSVARDLMALYRLGPWRIGTRTAAELWVDERGLVRASRVDRLRMRYGAYRRSGPLLRPRRLEMRRAGSSGYLVRVRVREIVVDPRLDSRLFRR